MLFWPCIEHGQNIGHPVTALHYCFAPVSCCVGRPSDICFFNFTSCSMCRVHCLLINYYRFVLFYLFFMLTLCRMKKMIIYKQTHINSASNYKNEARLHPPTAYTLYNSRCASYSPTMIASYLNSLQTAWHKKRD